MSLKSPAQRQQPHSSALFKTFHREAKRIRLPSIHNENHCHNQLIENRYCHNNSRLVHAKGATAPLTIRQNTHNHLQHQLHDPSQRSELKKVGRPSAVKPRSLISELASSKKSPIEERSSSCSHRMSMKLERLSIRNTMILCPSSELKATELALNTLHLDKAIIPSGNMSLHRAPFRDRTNSCRVSFKRVFPTQERPALQAQNPNVSVYFNRNQERLSTIPGDQQEQSNFISVDSFTELIS